MTKPCSKWALHPSIFHHGFFIIASVPTGVSFLDSVIFCDSSERDTLKCDKTLLKYGCCTQAFSSWFLHHSKCHFLCLIFAWSLWHLVLRCNCGFDTMVAPHFSGCSSPLDLICSWQMAPMPLLEKVSFVKHFNEDTTHKPNKYWVIKYLKTCFETWFNRNASLLHT